MIMKLAMTTHFSGMEQWDWFPSLQRNSQYKRCHEADLYDVDMLPHFFQSNIQKNINKLRGEIPTYLEEEFETLRKI